MKNRRSKQAAKLSRRQFLKSSAAAGAAIACPAIVPSSVLGAGAPSNRITLGCIGLGGQGTGNMKAFNGKPDCEVLAVCDADVKHMERALKTAGLSANSAYTDFREVLVRDDIDAVSIATPDHWHVPMAAASIIAGKDVYVEKPLSHTIAEGRLLVNLARKHGKMIQHGTQIRSTDGTIEAIEYLKSGKLGNIRMVKAIPEYQKVIKENNIPCLEINYETLFKKDTLTRIYRFLEVVEPEKIIIPHRKLNDISRYKQLGNCREIDNKFSNQDNGFLFQEYDLY